MAAILTTIAANVSTLIDAMSIATGSTYDWVTPNQPDDTLTSYPRAMVFFDSEECNDRDRGTSNNVYASVASMRIVVDVAIPSETPVPQMAAYPYCHDAVDDLLRLFGKNPSLLSGGSLPVKYDGFEIEDYASGDYFVVKRITTNWLVPYTRCRTNPTITGL